MQLTLRVTSVIPHANNTQTVTLQEPPRELLPVRMGENTAAGGSLRVGPAPVRIPPPAPRGPVAVMLTNISTDEKFEQGKEYTISIS